MGRHSRTFRLGIVGAGPSCSYVLERLAATIEGLPEGVSLRIDVYDRSGQFGAGLVHSTLQPHTSYLNRIVGQVAFGADESVEGAGRLLASSLRPTLHEWCRQRFEQTGDPAFDLAPEDWPRRYVHGLALADCFSRYVSILREHPAVEVELHASEVLDLVDRGVGLEIVTGDGEATALVDHVLLVTGHSSNDPKRSPRLAELVRFAERAQASFVPCAYPLEENLPERVSDAGHVVACRGMGLTAIDVILYLTEARGGRFESGDSGLRYLPSGREPSSIVPFSESGLFTFARPFNAKEQNLRELEHRGVFLTYEAIDRLRAAAGEPIDLGQLSGRRQLDFERHIFPVLLLEMSYVYYRTMLGEEFAAALRERVSPRYQAFLRSGAPDAPDVDPAEFLLSPVRTAVDEAVQALDGVLAGTRPYSSLPDGAGEWQRAAFRRHLEVVFGAEPATAIESRLSAGASPAEALEGRSSRYAQPLMAAEKAFSWQATIEPIPAERQRAPADYRAAMEELFERDHAWAAQGNVENPAKAAADGVWRDLRPVLAYAVDFGGLTAASHSRFLDVYMRHHNRLANGAGLEVMERIRALVRGGFVDVSVGPHASIECDEESGRFCVAGGRTGALVQADTLIDARVHPFDPERDVLPLYPNMIRRGLVRKWRNPAPGGAYEPGGLDLSPDFHPIRLDGTVDRRLTLLGPPSEGVMFFQLGALRPQQNHHVMRDILMWLHEFWRGLERYADDVPTVGMI